MKDSSKASDKEILKQQTIKIGQMKVEIAHILRHDEMIGDVECIEMKFLDPVRNNTPLLPPGSLYQADVEIERFVKQEYQPAVFAIWSFLNQQVKSSPYSEVNQESPTTPHARNKEFSLTFSASGPATKRFGFEVKGTRKKAVQELFDTLVKELPTLGSKVDQLTALERQDIAQGEDQKSALEDAIRTEKHAFAAEIRKVHPSLPEETADHIASLAAARYITKKPESVRGLEHRLKALSQEMPSEKTR